MFKIALLITTLLFISSCGINNWSREANLFGEMKKGLRQIDHVNRDVKMDIIDEIPSMDITIIRFIDAGHTRYIAVRKDQLTVMSENSTGGKHPVYEDASIYTR